MLVGFTHIHLLHRFSSFNGGQTRSGRSNTDVTATTDKPTLWFKSYSEYAWGIKLLQLLAATGAACAR